MIKLNETHINHASIEKNYQRTNTNRLVLYRCSKSESVLSFPVQFDLFGLMQTTKLSLDLNAYMYVFFYLQYAKPFTVLII